MDSESIKILYFAPRPEGRSQADFVARWRGHGEFGMSLPLWRHIPLYKHHDALTPAESGIGAGAPATAEDRFGGVGEWWVRDGAALEEMSADPDVPRLRIDEEEAFGRDIAADQLLTRERVVHDVGPAERTLFSLIHRAPGTDRTEFDRRWTAIGERIAAAPALTRHLCRYVQDVALPETTAVDGVAELGFASTAELEAFFAEPVWSEEIVPAVAAFCDCDRKTSLLTREVLLYDEPA